MKVVVIFCLLLISSVFGKQGFGPTDQEWGYVNVRENANMFWWLHYTTADSDPSQRPLVIWLQGGPGASSTGYGNFMEIGPINVHQEERNTSWIHNVNLLFVDNPVGSGFSYVDDNAAYTTNNTQIAADFLELMKGFYKELSIFENVPLYIFSESYGGKMTAEIALVLYQESRKGNINCKISGVGLGDSWISPVDSVLGWAPYLLNIGAIDEIGYEEISNSAQELKTAADKGDYEEVTFLCGAVEELIAEYTFGIDFYNVLTKIASTNSKTSNINQYVALKDTEEELLEGLMNGEVKSALNLNHNWGASSGDVFNALNEDFMKPVTDIVERLLNETDIEVVVYNGQLDLIVDTPGTVSWVNALKWNGSEKWKKADRSAFSVDGYYEGYLKTVDKLHLYWVNRAGHMVPANNPAAMTYILSETTRNYTTHF